MPLLGVPGYVGTLELQPGGAGYLVPAGHTSAEVQRWIDAHTVAAPLIDPESLFAAKEVFSAFTGGADLSSSPQPQMFDEGGNDMDFPDFGGGSPDFPWSGNGQDVGGSLDLPSDMPDFGGGGPDISLPIDLGGIGDVIGAPNSGGGLVRTQAAAAIGAGAGLALRGMSQIVAGAILKLKQALGGGGFLTAGGIASFGSRTGTALTSWAARNPGLSVISTLVGLGLTVEEAAHFLAWGTTRRHKRRRRGITYRDMRTTRRTMARVISMSHQLRVLCGAAPHRVHHRYYSPPHRRGRVSA